MQSMRSAHHLLRLVVHWVWHKMLHAIASQSTSCFCPALQPIRLLGTGGFGEVYLCHWHSCDVAVKCLNPSLLVPDGAMGSISKVCLGPAWSCSTVYTSMSCSNV